mmetsp:Transcript_23802/g.64159  ORF Transcript_23802/g.64159 Transcript_23802/m.64159 type:complete len:357 (+) Transcript_23802:96-1166(+)
MQSVTTFAASLCVLLAAHPRASLASVSVGPVPEDVKAVMGWGDLYANVFGANIVARGVAESKVQHAANVMASYLDNDNDGKCDDSKVCDMLIENTAMLVMFQTSDDADEFLESADMLWYGINMMLNGEPWYQDLYGDETHPDSCAFKSAGVSTDEDCTDEFDATLEEVLHLLTSGGVSQVYEDDWGESEDSTFGGYMADLNGDCGNGYTHDWIDPSSDDCDGWYAYDDETCDFECLCAEGLYWSLTSLLGAQVYREDDISHEWTLANATKLAKHAADLTAMLQDTESWSWLPANLPDGSYSGQPEEVIPYLVNYAALFLVLLLVCVVGCCGACWRLYVVKSRAKNSEGGAAKGAVV